MMAFFNFARKIVWERKFTEIWFNWKFWGFNIRFVFVFIFSYIEYCNGKKTRVVWVTAAAAVFVVDNDDSDGDDNDL